MAYTDDWESLMNGVFGAGGKLKFGGAQPQPEKPQPKKAWCGQCAAPLCWAPRAQPPAT